jgi:hypothetical protein
MNKPPSIRKRIQAFRLSQVVACFTPVFLILEFSEEATAQLEPKPAVPRLNQLASAYGFARIQELSLEVIRKQFPDLQQQVDHSSAIFTASAFGEGAKGVVLELEEQLGADEWLANKESTEKQLKTLLPDKAIKREEAVAYLDEVRQRAKGQISEPIRSTLLSTNPRFLRDPAAEFAEGFRRMFRSKGHPKSKGADLLLSLPASWSSREGYRPNIVQVFESGNGNGRIMCSILVKDLGVNAEELPTHKVREMLEPSSLKDFIPDGAVMIDAEAMDLDGAPAGMVIFDLTEQKLDTSFTMRMTHFVTIQKDLMIAIQFAINSAPDTDVSLDDMQKRHLPLFRAIANSFVYNDRYN